MNIGIIIKSIMKVQKVGQDELAETLGLTSGSVVSSRIRADNMSVNVAASMLEALGYELVVRPKEFTAGESYAVTLDTPYKNLRCPERGVKKPK